MAFATKDEIDSVVERVESLLERDLTDLEFPMVELAIRYYAQLFGGN